jgi:hypothetical protein
VAYYTPAQVGDASVPDAHRADAPPTYDVRGDDLPTDTPEGDQPQYVTSRWRAPMMLAGPGSGGAAFDGNPVSDHASRGVPDRRRQYGASQPAGYPEPADESLRPSPEELSNSRTAPVLVPSDAPPRARAGSTGEDPARPAEVARWLFNRPFGKWAADDAPAIVKIESLPPLAASPYAQADPTDPAYYSPNPGGDGLTVNSNATAGSHANTVRPIPRPWDENLTVNDPAAPDTSTLPSGRRWRLG